MEKPPQVSREENSTLEEAEVSTETCTIPETGWKFNRVTSDTALTTVWASRLVLRYPYHIPRE
jgi:hypothetical protein